MKVYINGELTILKSKAKLITINKLLEELNYNPKLVVIELNGFIIESLRWNNEKINDNDKIEIVTLVGGGSLY